MGCFSLMVVPVSSPSLVRKSTTSLKPVGFGSSQLEHSTSSMGTPLCPQFLQVMKLTDSVSYCSSETVDRSTRDLPHSGQSRAVGSISPSRQLEQARDRSASMSWTCFRKLGLSSM